MVALLVFFWSAGTLFSTIREEATTALVIIILLLIVMIPLAAGIVSGLTATPDKTYGPINPQMVCPHCNTTGRVRTKTLIQKKGISGGKATATILTGGLSLLVTGLSRRERKTQGHCTHCNNTWVF